MNNIEEKFTPLAKETIQESQMIQDYVKEKLQSQLDTFMSCIPEKVEEKEAKFKDDKNGLLSEGYTIGYNEAIKHLLQNLKNKGIL